MKKLKIYLDTSVISHLKQDDAPDKTQDTLKLWEDIKSGNFKHMVNIKTIRGVRAIANLQGDQSIDIIQPTMLIQSEEE